MSIMLVTILKNVNCRMDIQTESATKENSTIIKLKRPDKAGLQSLNEIQVK